jgi:hypothetical protein
MCQKPSACRLDEGAVSACLAMVGRERGDSIGCQGIDYFSNLPEVLGFYGCRFMELSLVGGEEKKVGWLEN